MVKTGRPVTKPGRKRVTFNLPPEDMEYLKEIARGAGISASEYLHRLIIALKAGEITTEHGAHERREA